VMRAIGMTLLDLSLRHSSLQPQVRLKSSSLPRQ
jgi:hypothetical protein